MPGVTYPEALSTNLNSKRTSHKIAEQGRRNRINTALQEMQSLLPSPDVTASPGVGGGGAGGGGGARSPGIGVGAGGTPIQQANSKAATVESAIEYIKLLERERSSIKLELESRDKELAEVRKAIFSRE